MKRRATRQIQVGTVPIAGDASIAVQSMTTTYTCNVQATVAQIHRLEEVSCELVRVASLDQQRGTEPSSAGELEKKIEREKKI